MIRLTNGSLSLVLSGAAVSGGFHTSVFYGARTPSTYTVGVGGSEGFGCRHAIVSGTGETVLIASDQITGGGSLDTTEIDCVNIVNREPTTFDIAVRVNTCQSGGFAVNEWAGPLEPNGKLQYNRATAWTSLSASGYLKQNRSYGTVTSGHVASGQITPLHFASGSIIAQSGISITLNSSGQLVIGRIT